MSTGHNKLIRRLSNTLLSSQESDAPASRSGEELGCAGQLVKRSERLSGEANPRLFRLRLVSDVVTDVQRARVAARGREPGRTGLAPRRSLATRRTFDRIEKNAQIEAL